MTLISQRSPSPEIQFDRFAERKYSPHEVTRALVLLAAALEGKEGKEFADMLPDGTREILVQAAIDVKVGESRKKENEALTTKLLRLQDQAAR